MNLRMCVFESRGIYASVIQSFSADLPVTGFWQCFYHLDDLDIQDVIHQSETAAAFFIISREEPEYPRAAPIYARN